MPVSLSTFTKLFTRSVYVVVALVMAVGFFSMVQSVEAQTSRCQEIVVPVGEEVPPNNSSCFLPNSAPCTNNNQCASFLCSGGRCAGDRLCSKPTFTRTDVDFSRSCYDHGSSTFKHECNDGYSWNGTRCAPQNCASGWACGTECASTSVVSLFNSTWCDGEARWKYESGNGQGISCGGRASELRSLRNCIARTCTGAEPNGGVEDSLTEQCNRNGVASRQCKLGYRSVDFAGYIDCYPNIQGDSANPLPLGSCTSACPDGRYCVCPDNCPVTGRINPGTTRRVCTHETVTLQRCNDTCPPGRICNCPAAGCTRSGQITASSSERTCGGAITYDNGSGQCGAVSGTCAHDTYTCSTASGRVEHPSIRCSNLVHPAGVACCVPQTSLEEIENLIPCSSTSYVAANNSAAEKCRKPDGTVGWVCRPGYTMHINRCVQNTGTTSPAQPMPLDTCNSTCPDGRFCICPRDCRRTTVINRDESPRTCQGVATPTPSPTATPLPCRVDLTGCQVASTTGATACRLPSGATLQCCRPGQVIINNRCMSVISTPTPTPTPTPSLPPGSQECAVGLTCNVVRPTGSSPCIARGTFGTANPVTTHCCPAGQNILNGACTTSTATPVPTPTPPACGTELECQNGNIPGISACVDRNGTIGYCCPSGQRLVNGTCVLPTPGDTCNNTDSRWVTNSVDTGGQCCGGGTLECRSGRCNAANNQIGSCLPPLPATPVPTPTPSVTPAPTETPMTPAPTHTPGTPEPTSTPRPTPTPRPNCTYTYSEWSECRAGLQNRQIVNVTPNNCVGTPEPLVRACGDHFRCETDNDCESYSFCYQPPMPECLPGMSCPQVMPVKECQLRKEVADINEDNKVNILDLSVLLKNLLTADPKSDVNSDGLVDIIDYSLMVRRLSAKPHIDQTNR